MTRTKTPRTALLAAALTIPAFIVATQLYVGYRMRGVPVVFSAVLLLQLCHWEAWLAAAPIVWDLERRWPLAQPRPGAALTRHAVAAVVVAAGILALNLAAYQALIRVPGLSAWFAGFDRSLAASALVYSVSYFHIELLVYAGIVALAHAVRTDARLREKERDALRLEAELTGARLLALRTQLQPHFLFNTLHTIGSLVLQRETDRAVQLIAVLGELLRGTLAHRDVDLAPLRDEIGYLQKYLAIEEARFGDRLRVEWAIDPATLDALVPPFILQPLIENAFRHGIAHRADDSVLRIASAPDEGSLRVTIYNDGPPLAAAIDSGYGLKNVRERLRTRTPAGRLELADAEGGVRATLLMPRWSVE